MYTASMLKMSEVRLAGVVGGVDMERTILFVILCYKPPALSTEAQLSSHTHTDTH